MAAEKIAFMYKVFLTRGYTLIKLVKFWPVETPSPRPCSLRMKIMAKIQFIQFDS